MGDSNHYVGICATTEVYEHNLVMHGPKGLGNCSQTVHKPLLDANTNRHPCLRLFAIIRLL